jgi:hypothetical protein
MAAAAAQAIRNKGSGEPMNPSTRRPLENRMGVDLSDVRIHSDHSAHSAARALKARAFTHGKDIWLGPGASQNDQRLMAHEAVHVVQQTGRARRVSKQGQDISRKSAPGIQRWGFLKRAWRGVKRIGGSVLDAARRIGGAAVSLVRRFGSRVLSYISTWGRQVVNWISRWGIRVISWLRRWGARVIQWIIRWGVRVIQWLVQYGIQVIQWLIRWSVRVIQWLVRWGIQVIQWLIEWSVRVIQWLIQWGVRVIQWLIEWGVRVIQWLIRWGIRVIDWLIEFGAWIIDVIIRLGIIILDWIRRIARAIKKGLRAAWEWIVATARAIGLAILKFLACFGPKIPFCLINFFQLKAEGNQQGDEYEEEAEMAADAVSAQDGRTIEIKQRPSNQVIQRYSEDIHYDMTKKEAMAIIKDPTIAETIAAENKAVDTRWGTHPWIRFFTETFNPFISGRDFLHFPARSVAISELRQAIAACDPVAFGAAMHRYQDSYSHNFQTWSTPFWRICSSCCWLFGPVVAPVLLPDHPFGRGAVLKHLCLFTYPDQHNGEQLGRDATMRAETRFWLSEFLKYCSHVISGPPGLLYIIGSQTVARTPGLRTRTTIGVGEEVDLTHPTGSVMWSATAGTLSARTGATVRLTAPDTTQTVTVTGGGDTIDFTVLAPSGVHMDRYPGTGIRHTQTLPDSGIQTLPFLLPDNVNFYNIRYHEVDSAATASGHWTCQIGDGHDPHPATLTLSDTVVAGKGTQANAQDSAYSGHCGSAAPLTPGHKTWVIPYEYIVGTGSFIRFVAVTQVHTLAADRSTCNSDKAGAHGDTTVASPNSTY